MGAARGVLTLLSRPAGLRAAAFRLLKLALALGLMAVLVWWLFRDTDLTEIWTRIRDADFVVLGLAVAVSMVVTVARAVRWRYFLSPVHPAPSQDHGGSNPAGSRRRGGPFRSRFAAVCTGLAANVLFPSGRVGEFLRAYAYGRMEPVPTTAAFATLVVERFMDGVAIVALLFVAVASPSFPADMLPSPLAAGIRAIVGVLAAVLAGSILFAAFPERTATAFESMAVRTLPSRWASRASAAVAAFTTGFASLRDWRLLLPAWTWSFALWTIQSLSLWIGLFAFDIRLPFAAGLFINATTAFAVAVPAPAPGYGGLWQGGAKVALVSVYGVAEEPVLAYALAWQLTTSVPIIWLGLWYARRLGLSMRTPPRR